MEELQNIIYAADESVIDLLLAFVEGLSGRDSNTADNDIMISAQPRCCEDMSLQMKGKP